MNPFLEGFQFELEKSAGLRHKIMAGLISAGTLAGVAKVPPSRTIYPSGAVNAAQSLLEGSGHEMKAMHEAMKAKSLGKKTVDIRAGLTQDVHALPVDEAVEYHRGRMAEFRNRSNEAASDAARGPKSKR